MKKPILELPLHKTIEMQKTTVPNAPNEKKKTSAWEQAELKKKSNFDQPLTAERLADQDLKTINAQLQQYRLQCSHADNQPSSHNARSSR